MPCFVVLGLISGLVLAQRALYPPPDSCPQKFLSKINNSLKLSSLETFHIQVKTLLIWNFSGVT
jgi:hypothetical protein